MFSIRFTKKQKDFDKDNAVPSNLISFHDQHIHLEKVSRTFALTIPILPDNLCDWVSNAYLLCRIADTVEDDPKASSDKKYAWLVEFGNLAASGFGDEIKLLSLHRLGVELVRGGAKESEFLLMQDMVKVVTRTLSYDVKVRQILARGVSILSYGMAQSVKGKSIRSLSDLDGYCYFVAGVVGEVLACLFSLCDEKINRQQLLTLSVSFGEGLQLTNILKDRAEDRQRGVAFLPEGSENLQVADYIAITQGHLDDALRFILMIPPENRGIRQFCLMNIAMATATLKKIAKKPDADGFRLKISRRIVKFLYVMCAISCKSNTLTSLLFRFLSSGVSRNSRDPELLRKNVSWWDKETYCILLTEK